VEEYVKATSNYVHSYVHYLRGKSVVTISAEVVATLFPLKQNSSISSDFPIHYCYYYYYYGCCRNGLET